MSTPTAAEKKASTGKKQAAYPRDMKLVNETPIPYVVARKHLPPGESVPVTVKDEDELKRIETDIGHLMELNGSYKELEVQPLRIVEAE